MTQTANPNLSSAVSNIGCDSADDPALSDGKCSRHHRRPDTGEGDGYVVAVVDNLVTNDSDLVVLDALKVEDGPIARVKLPFRLRSGRHGNWADAGKVKG